MNCRLCGSPVQLPFVDLGTSPPSNAYLREGDLRKPETYYPLQVLVCTHCWLVQTRDFARADELFTDNYAYFSSVSSTWLEHAVRYCELIIERLSLGPSSFVLEVAANDGYLLRNFVAAGIPCLGIEPTASTASEAEKLGIPIVHEFFGVELARGLAAQGRRADLVIANNVIAHVPDLNDFVAGLALILGRRGVITLEFAHLLQLITDAQFDTIYHEHFSYFSLSSAQRLLARHGLHVWDVEQLPTHGGSLRLYACHESDARPQSERVGRLIDAELQAGLLDVATYRDFQRRAEAVKDGLLSFLLESKRRGATVAAYGAAAKGNTLLNFAGIKTDLLQFVCDAAPAKQGQYLPGSRIPILPPSALRERRPDYVLILPWNLAEEIRAQCAYVLEWGGRFVRAVPHLDVLD